MSEIVKCIKNVSVDTSLNKKDKEKMIFGLEKLLLKATDRESNCIRNAITLLKNGRLTIENKNKFIECRPMLLKIVNKYEEIFRERSISNMIGENLAIEELELKLDATVTKYNKFNENNPMKLVTYDKNGRYRIRMSDKCTTRVNKTDATKLALSFMCENINTEIIIDRLNVEIDMLTYKHNKIICYKYQDNNFYDMAHVINMMKLDKTSQGLKRNEFRDEIKFMLLCTNVHGGYILRELIGIKTVKKMIYKSNKRGAVILAHLLNINTFDHKRISKENSTIQNIISVFKFDKVKESYSVGKYYVDLYFLDTKLAVECDEHNHSNRDPEYEKTRQLYIEKKLGCKFVRFNPDDDNFDIFDVVSKIHYHIMTYRDQ